MNKTGLCKNSASTTKVSFSFEMVMALLPSLENLT